MRKLTLLAMLLVSCQDETLVPENKCGVPCAVYRREVLFNKEAEAVTCRASVSVCDSNGVPSCPDYIPPQPEEICGYEADDDCDPSTKESDIRLPPSDPRNRCRYTEVGACQNADLVCVDGELVCDPYHARSEVCDEALIDEDCDSLVNGDDPNLVISIPPFAYEDDISTANVGICRAGVARCVDGKETYEGMVLPGEEICGNQTDDDCDGLVDELADGAGAQSFLLAIDYSGSMEANINAVETAVCRWAVSRAGDDARSDDRFAVVAFGIYNNYGMQDDREYFYVVTPFVSASEACDALLGFRYTSTINEYSAYSVLRFFDYYSWPENTENYRNVIMFTDENYQVFRLNDTARMIENCQAEGYRVGLYCAPEYQDTFAEITSNCNGWVEYLSYDPDEMVASLSTRFAGVCE